MYFVGLVSWICYQQCMEWKQEVWWFSQLYRASYDYQSLLFTSWCTI